MDLTKFTPIKGFENNYLICKDTQTVFSIIKGTTMKGSINRGYIAFHFKLDSGKTKIKKLHRIMMETFCQNKSSFKSLPKEDRTKINLNDLVINHKDGNKLNNNLENLEWCTQAYNNAEAYRLGLRVVSEKTREQFMRDCHTPEIQKKAIENLRKSKDKAIAHSIEANSKPLALFKDNFYKEFKNDTEACKFLGVHKGSVGRVARGKLKTIKGYKAKYI